MQTKTALFFVAGLITVFFVACNLTDETVADEEAGLRLLVGSGETAGLLSSPGYNDWAPQRYVTGAGTWLYFLSDRPWVFNDPQMGSITNKNHKLLRALEVSPGVYSNLEVVWQTAEAAGISGYALLKPLTDLGETQPRLLLSMTNADNPLVPALFSVSYEPGIFSPYAGVGAEISGDTNVIRGQLLDYRHYRIQTAKISINFHAIFVRLPSGVIRAFFSKDYSDFVWSGVVETGTATTVVVMPQIRLPLDTLLAARGVTAGIRGGSLFVGKQPGDPQLHCGFVLSVGGVIQTVFGRAVYDQTATYDLATYLQAGPEAYVVSPLFALKHVPGFADVTPFVDKSGIYFASDRAGRGNFDLYFSERINQTREGDPDAESSASSSSASGI